MSQIKSEISQLIFLEKIYLIKVDFYLRNGASFYDDIKEKH